MKINRSCLKNAAINFISFLVIALVFGWILCEPVTTRTIMYLTVDAPGIALIFVLFIYRKNKTA